MVTTVSELTRLWDKTLKVINNKLKGDTNTQYFFADSYVYDRTGNTLVVVVSRLVNKAVIEEKYLDLIKDSLLEVQDEKLDVKIITKEEADSKFQRKIAEIKDSNSNVTYFENAKVDPNLRFDNFVVGEFNKEAHNAALFVAKNGGTMFNPLFIHSHSGLGKTHLLHAIGNEIKGHRMPNANVLYITAMNFVEDYVKFVKGDKESQSLRDYFKGVDVLLLDDIQFLGGRVKSEEMFFYVYQDLINSGKRVILTSDRQPNELKGLEDRLVTRFTQGLTVSINEPDVETCVEILKQEISKSGLNVNKFDANVLYFVAEKYSRDVRELQGALNKLVFVSLSLKDNETVTMDLALKTLSSLKGGKYIATQLDEQKIINIIADYYNLTASQITGKDRTGQIVLARHLAMYLIRKHLDVPLTKIGKTFGGKDHTTVMSALTKVEKELKTDKQLQSALDELEKKIKK